LIRRLLNAAFDLPARLEEANHRRVVRGGAFNNNRRPIACRRLQRLLAAYAAGEIRLEQVTASVQGWVNHVRPGDTWGLRRAVIPTLQHPHTPTPPYPHTPF
jgi:hypothetical protein